MRPTDSPLRSLRRSQSIVACAALIAIPMLALAACAAPAARVAPFRYRPDSVASGELRGPFSGRVVDGVNDQPVAGALVYATWSFESGYGVSTAAGFRQYLTSTDASGYYRVPRLDKLAKDKTRLGPGARLTNFHLVIYKRGFVAYRSDRRFPDMGPRRDFSQMHHRVRLERWRHDFSHAQHLRYVGGGPALTSLTEWEAEDAAAELSGTSRKPQFGANLVRRPGSAIVAARLISSPEIKAITGYGGAFETGPLGDQPDTDRYSSQHFKAMGRPESADIAVRLWKLPLKAAKARYQSFIDSLPNTQQTNEIATRSLRAVERNAKRRFDIHGIAFIDEKRGVVMLMTCGETQCTTADKAAAIGVKMHEKIKRLWPLGVTK